MLLLGLGGAMAVGSAGTVAVNAVDPSRTGVAGGLSFTVHLACGAIGVAGGTAIMYASSNSTLHQGLADAGINMSPIDQATLNAAAAGADATTKVLSNYSEKASATIQNLMTEGFTRGTSHAYWLALAAAVIGLVLVMSINEKKLKGADAKVSKA